MGIVDSVIKFSIKKNFGKWIKGAVTGLVAVSTPYLAKYVGLELTEDQKTQVIIASASAIAGVTNILKIKFPSIFGWL